MRTHDSLVVAVNAHSAMRVCWILGVACTVFSTVQEVKQVESRTISKGSAGLTTGNRAGMVLSDNKSLFV